MLDSLGEVAGQVGEGGQQEVAERVPLQPPPLSESVLEESAEQRFVLRHRDQAITDVAGRKNIEITPETAGAASIIRDRDDGGDLQFRSPELVYGRSAHVLFQSVQQPRKARAAADGDNA